MGARASPTTPPNFSPKSMHRGLPYKGSPGQLVLTPTSFLNLNLYIYFNLSYFIYFMKLQNSYAHLCETPHIQLNDQTIAKIQK